tara:strand:- start:3352 stop:4605 length:1254 start_codon:yes stop_codon:yes gene_type:complete
MAISIDWATKVINVPKVDTTLVQASPIEIRELNLNGFRLALKDLEDDAEGMTFVDTHKHNGEVLLGGIIYARVLEIINGYTVTFEDGAYALNLVGANSNVGDVINFNQVSVRTANAAGLISNAAIEFSSFNGGVIVDIDNITGQAGPGTIFPAGTRQRPCLDLADAALIASTRGFSQVTVIGNATLDGTSTWTRFQFIGESPLKTTLSIEIPANVLNCEVYNCLVTGTLDGNTHIEDCVLSDLNFVDGYIYKCALGPGVIKLGTSVTSNIFSCYSTVPGTGSPTIDMNETGILALRDYYGSILLKNYIGNGSHSVDLSAGEVKLDTATITSGTFVIRGSGKLTDENGVRILSGLWNGGVTIINETSDVVNYLVEELHQLQGLDKDNPMVVTPTTITSGNITLNLTGDGTNITTITRP